MDTGVFDEFAADQLAEAAKRQAMQYGYQLDTALKWVFSSAKSLI